jgi:hypothetical protein
MVFQRTLSYQSWCQNLLDNVHNVNEDPHDIDILNEITVYYR